MDTPAGLERVSALEASVIALAEKVTTLEKTIANGFDRIQAARDAAAKTDWNTIIAASILVLALYAAAIRPLNTDVERQTATATTLATAVLEQNRATNEARIAAAVHFAVLEYQMNGTLPK